jgi:hypothetical protein
VGDADIGSAPKNPQGGINNALHWDRHAYAENVGSGSRAR